MDRVFGMCFHNGMGRLGKMQSSNKQGAFFYKGASFFVVSSIIFCQLEKTLCLTNDLTNSYSQPFKLQFMSTNEVFQFKSNEVLQSFPNTATVKWPTTTAGCRWSNPTGAKLLGPNKSWLQQSQLPPGFPKRHRVKYSSHGSYSDFLVNMKQ